MDAQTRLPLSPGTVVAGRYRVEHALGAGGMGSVVAAYDLVTRASVAIKHLLPRHAGNRDAEARFQREGRLSAWIKSDHVARVLDSGEIGCPGIGTSRYLVMERLDGRDLRSLVREQGPLPIHEAVGYVRQACIALAEAHALGVVHRDLKPANLFCARGADGAPIIKVLDFGIAKFMRPGVAGDDIEVTGPATMIGSRPYMSPEQMLDAKEVDARSDVWALGTILFYLITGVTPFEGESSCDLALNILQGEPRSLSGLRPGVPPGLDAVIRRCLEKVRDRRFAGVVELSEALAPFASRRGRTRRPEAGAGPRRRGWVLAAAGVAVALTVAASALAFSAHPGTRPVRGPPVPGVAPG
jgi:serine/threonine-protein kinase